jgi:outer membrane protein OmpA-like peptidoglycan-associated protein
VTPLALLAAMLLPTAPPAFAADEVPGAKDHPMLSRYPNSRITEYEQNYNAVEFLVAGERGKAPAKRSVEGDATRIKYYHDDPQKQPSALQLIRNYQNAIRQIGGSVLYERLPGDLDGGETTLRATAGGKDVWVKVAVDIFAAPTQAYQLTFVETAAMQQAVTANKLLDELTRNGFVALYINFDTGRADLKDDGVATVREIVALMKSNPGLKLGVEGHTDNAGDAQANKVLSLARANSVAKAVVAGGIDAARLSTAGFGQERPVADNRSEEGRAKNRRVELVKK